jgi:hydroxymethylpyrimidine pyrophosphatase-like HAD family hydrolase
MSAAATSLLFRVVDLTDQLNGAVRDRRWMDAALAAAGIMQATDDELGGTLSPIVTAAGKLRDRTDGPGRAATLALDTVVGLMRTPRWITRQRHERSPYQWREDVAQLSVLAAELASGSVHGPEEERRAARLLAALGPPPARVGLAVARIPSCFRAFDQHPDDVAAIVAEFAARWPDRSRPILVVGIRTSGSYLAPFTVAALRQAGFRSVSMISARPGQRPLPHDRSRQDTAVRDDAVALVVDDPPTTGNAVARVCAALVRAGLPAGSVVVGLALFDDAPDLPAPLSRFESVTLPWARWSIHRRLGPDQVAGDLGRLVGPAVLEELEEVPLPASPPRTHSTRLYRVTVSSPERGREVLSVLATGTGLGYFGQHDLVVAAALSGRVPDVLGTGDGVLYLRWPLHGHPVPPSPAQVVEYVAARHAALPVAQDLTAQLRGSQPVWEVASNHLGRAYGRYWPVARLAFVDRLTRHLLRTPAPSVPDGDMRPERWIADADSGRTVKTGFAERAFSNFDLVSLDDRIDVVGAAVHVADQDYAEELRRAYALRTGGGISPERWLLYELVHLWDVERQGLADPEAVRRRKSHAMRRHLAGLLLADVTPPVSGPVVALDVDGVLETDIWGFDAPSPGSLLCLRALHRHGYRSVVLTGRSLDDVIELSELYGLAGGAAEYGSVCYHRSSGATLRVADAATLDALDRFRETLRLRPDVHVDARHRHSVRASSVDARGRFGALSTADEALVPAELHAVVGDRQTDVIGSGVDKARGGQVLLEALGEARPAFAVGDTAADTTMLGWASGSVVPRHASAEARAAAGRTARRPYQSGLEDAVTQLLGHRPGRCPLCAPPALRQDTLLLLALLRIPEGSQAQALARTLPLVRRLARVTA